ncbi:TetR/AcrR family transcriptional regulator [Arthrobacter agilis]|uniref:TetR/AcrR family transcriptional regulator n=1 Tax=Arthrobacter agilis TaxID=37921 RepID=UPI000F7DDF7A|nr:TetR/AcrR family transcriptional regulator [Arthrobacter agilis]TPV22474.1 TetR/AcrR family transcriptional regulator [Arthrobacter agilis]
MNNPGGMSSVGRPGSRGQRTGRPYDHSSDGLILASTLDLLAGRGYEKVTLDEVSLLTGRAKSTLYRRWATKEELVLAAVRSVGRPPEVDLLPDLGSLREDLLAVIDSPWLGSPNRRLAIFAGLASATRSSERLAAVVRTEVTEPYVEVYRRLLHRATDRGEISANFVTSIPVLAEVIPAMSTHRLNTSHEPVHRDFFVSVIDNILLAALHPTGD